MWLGRIRTSSSGFLGNEEMPIEAPVRVPLSTKVIRDGKSDSSHTNYYKTFMAGEDKDNTRFKEITAKHTDA